MRNPEERYPEPIAECWWCNEDIYLEDQEYCVIEGKVDGEYKQFPIHSFEHKECLEAIGLELNWKEDYFAEDEEYNFCVSFAEYVWERGVRFIHEPTDEELRYAHAELKWEEEQRKKSLLKQGREDEF